jgi:hypothetical protein
LFANLRLPGVKKSTSGAMSPSFVRKPLQKRNSLLLVKISTPLTLIGKPLNNSKVNW